MISLNRSYLASVRVFTSCVYIHWRNPGDSLLETNKHWSRSASGRQQDDLSEVWVSRGDEFNTQWFLTRSLRHAAATLVAQPDPPVRTGSGTEM